MPVIAQVAGTQQFEISKYVVDVPFGGTSPSVTVEIAMGQISPDGSVHSWAYLPSVILSGQGLVAAMGMAAKYVQQNLVTGMTAPQAYYAATKRALYEACQAAGAMPAGTLS